METVSIVPGNNGLERVVLSHPSGKAKAEIYLQGAHVTFWSNANGSVDENLLFVSQSANFSPSAPIRGGIPICFPQFADFGDLGQHGFLRNCLWRMSKQSGVSMSTDGESVRVTLEPERDMYEAMRRERGWKGEVEVEFDIVLTETELKNELRVKNIGKEDLDFTAALHTYFSVKDISTATVHGLQHTSYLDSMHQRQQFTESNLFISFSEETDRIYIHTPECLYIEDRSEMRRFAVQKYGFEDAVVWNPWIEKAKRMADFGDEEYKSMVCVETAAVRPALHLPAGGLWRGGHTLSAAPLE